MTGRTLYDRVRAAYGLDSDDLLLDAYPAGPDEKAAQPENTAVPSPERGRVLDPRAAPYVHPVRSSMSSVVDAEARGVAASPDADQLHNLATQLDGTSLGGKVNSVHVPFDPDDQSDDEVIVTSAYRRQAAKNRESSGHSGPSESAYMTSQRLYQSSLADQAQKTGSSHSTGSSAKRAPLSAAAPSFQSRATAFSPAPPPAAAVSASPHFDLPYIRGTAADGVERGQVYPGNLVAFCPWLIVTNYHLWFVGKQNGERIQPYFQTAALLQCQVWDFCYLWHPVEAKTTKNVLLVPTDQLQHLLNRINMALSVELAIPPGTNGDKFRIVFGQQGTPMPRFLGHAPDADMLGALVEAMPPLHPSDAFRHEESAAITGRTGKALDMFLKKVDGLLSRHDRSELRKKKADKARKKRLCDRQAVGRQIKRLQRYLGLRGRVGKGRISAGVSAATPPTLDLTQRVPFPQENDVILVSMDLESYEYNHRVVTEIGFGILDTRDVLHVPPGPACEGWHALIRGRHLRIREHVTMVNRSFVKGCENNFNFGNSEFVGLKDALAAVVAILQPQSVSGAARNVVLVGHGIKSDISLVKHIGFFLEDHAFLEVVDTQDIHQHLRMRSQQMGLEGVLKDLELEHSFLHNGGNDAVYTLQALVSLLVKKRLGSIRRQDEQLRAGYTPDPEVIEQGWMTGGEETDGGDPSQADDIADANAPEGPETSQPPLVSAPTPATNETPHKEATPREAGPALSATAPATAPAMPHKKRGAVGEDEDLIEL